ncbi:MAG: bifunctional DNA-formamidopyrimidine glycosylase/DNA-(apurinic or apyrimidinic site) lyase [Acidimicrobiales bacterium]
MPELPEAETVRRGLEAETVSRGIARVETTGLRSVRRHRDPDELDDRLRGRQVEAVGRVGKFLTLRAGGEVLVVHLGMSGQLLLSDGRDSRPKHSHVVLVFEDCSELRFVDPRTFGQVFLSTGPESSRRARPAELAHLGFDPLTDGLSAARFAIRLRARRSMLKALLMDQRFVAGIGNIYSDEILHAAGLRYDHPASALDDEQARALYRHMLRILRASVRLGGSSLSDMQYRDVYGRPGRYQERHLVFAREGMACAGCGGPIVRRAWAGRSTFFCPLCQAPGPA